jgi:hypothetical protein
MARTLIGQLILRLQTQGLGEAQKVKTAMSDIEAAAKRLGSAGVGSWGLGFQKQIDRLKLTRDEIGEVQRSWTALHDSIRDRGLDKAMRGAEISHWKTQTVSTFAQMRGEVDNHLREVEKKAQAHAGRMSTILKPGLVMLGAYTAPYLAGVTGVEALSASSERRREIFRQEMANIPEAERGQIFNRAEQLSQQYPSIPTTSIMEMARTARNTMGDTERGLQILEGMTKMFVTLQSMKGTDAALSQLDGLIRGIDNLGQNSSGALGIKNTLDIIEAMTRASQIEGDQFDPGTFWTFARRAKIAGPGLSNEFLGGVAPAFMQDMKPETFGAALSSAYQAFVIGSNAVASKANIQAQRDLGLRTGEGKGELVDSEMFGQNPYAWVKTHLVPALQKSGVDMNNDTDVNKAIAELTRNTHASGLLSRMVQQQEQVDRLIGLYRDAVGTDAADRARHEDPFVAWEAFKKSLENLSAALLPIDTIAAGLNKLADGINGLAKFGEDNPLLAAMGITGTGWAAYAGAKGVAGKMSDMFGLKGSALALDGSAAALTRAAIALGGSGVADVPGSGKNKAGVALPAAAATPLAVAALIQGSTRDNAYVNASAQERARMRAATAIPFRSHSEERERDFSANGFMRVGEGGAGGPGGIHAATMGPGTIDNMLAGMDRLRTEAATAGQEVQQSLSVTATPQVNLGPIQSLLSLIARARAELSSLGAAAEAAQANVGQELRRNFAD